MRHWIIWTGLLVALAGCASKPKDNPKGASPPPPKQKQAKSSPDKGAVRVRTLAGPDEFRGMFVTTAYNVDWPSQPGLYYGVADSEIEAIVQRAVDQNFNAIILQVRAFGDRIHRSSAIVQPAGGSVVERWSQSLAFLPPNDPHPNPFPGSTYDPLAAWIQKCHEHELQIFAWVDPYRTDYILTHKGAALPCFPSFDGEHMYLDPTSADVQEYLLAVVDDLIKPMIIPFSSGKGPFTNPDELDGVIIDHYFPDPNDPGMFLTSATAGTDRKPTTRRSLLTRKPPNARIDWLLRSNGMTPPYTCKFQTTAGNFLAEVYKKCNGRKKKFGFSPLHDQDGLVQSFIDPPDLARWHYLMPEIYQRTDEQPVANDFDHRLDVWKTLNDNMPGPNKPALVPVLMTGATEKPFRNKLWEASEIEDQMALAQGRSVGVAHFGSSALRDEKYGGPPGKQNVRAKVLKGKRYKDKARIPPGDQPAGALSNVVVTRANKQVILSLQNPSDVVAYWEVWTQDEPEVKLIKHDRVKLSANGHIIVRGIDAFDRKSPELDTTIP